MLHPGGADYKPTGPGPGGLPIAGEGGGRFKFRRKQIRNFKDLIFLYILELFIFILPVVDGDSSTPSPSSNTTHHSASSVTADTTPMVNSSPFNKVAGSVLVCLGVPIVSFLGLKLFVCVFPDCCQKSDFQRIKTNCSDCFISICCPHRKTNVVTPKITKGVDLFTTRTRNIIRDGAAAYDNDDDDVAALGGKNFLKMIVTLQKTKGQFHELLKARGNRRNSNSSVETLDGAIINTIPDDVESGHHIIVNDKFRSASRSPTPPPHIVVIYPEENVAATPKPSEFRPIRNVADLDGQDVSEMTPLEQNISHSNTSSPSLDMPELDSATRTTTDISVQNVAKSPSPFNQITTQAEVIAVDTPRSGVSGQSVPKNRAKILTRANTKESMCVIRIELPERTEPDGMEAPIMERPDRDDSSFLTVETDIYRGESDGGEDLHDIGEVDSYYLKSDTDPKLAVDKKPLKLDALSDPVLTHPDKVSLVRRGSYGCEANDKPALNSSIIVANASVANTPGNESNISPCSTCESSPGVGPGSSPDSVDPGSGDEADDDEEDSYYSISCPSSNGTPLTSQLNTPQQTPVHVKKSKHARNAKRLQELKSRDSSSQLVNGNCTDLPPLPPGRKMNPMTNTNVPLEQEFNSEKYTDLQSQQEPNIYDKQVISTQAEIHNSANPDDETNHALENNNNDTNSPVDDGTQQLTLSELPVKIVQDSQENLAQEIPERLQESPSNQPSTSDHTVKSVQGPEEQNKTIKQHDNQQNTLKSYSSRFKKPSSNLSTGVYKSPTRRVPQRPRTQMSSPALVKSKSNLSRSSKSSSQSSLDSPFKNITPGAHHSVGLLNIGTVENPSQKDQNQVPSLSKDIISVKKREGSPKRAVAAKKVAALLKKDSPTTLKKPVGSLKKESATGSGLTLPSFSYKKNISNASGLYSNKKFAKKVPGYAVAK